MIEKLKNKIKGSEKEVYYVRNVLFIILFFFAFVYFSVFLNNFIKLEFLDSVTLFFKEQKGTFILFSIFFAIFFLLLQFDKLKTISAESITARGKWGILVIFFILGFYTVLKLPHFDRSFTGYHPMKYNTYVEPAKYMLEQKEPFLFQAKYRAHPVNNPYGKFEFFDHLPLMEWGLATTYFLLPFNSLETNTRIFTHILGILILFSGYKFFRYWVSPKLTFLFLLLLVLNPIFNFATFVTVYDSILVLFTFLTLIFLTRYVQKNKFSDLYWGSLCLGVGGICKLSLFLWMYPLSFVFLYGYKKDISSFFRDYGVLLGLSLTVILVQKTTIVFFSSDLNKGLFFLFLWILFYVGLYFSLQKYFVSLKNFVVYFFKRKALLFVFCLLAVSFVFWGLKKIGITSYSSEFLTDRFLIFNGKLYWHMLLKFAQFMTFPVFYFGLLGGVLVLFSKNKNLKIMTLSFFTGVLFFWIMASKSIFFHEYYTLIIMVFFSLLSAYGFWVIHELFANRGRNFSAMILILLFMIVMPQQIMATQNYLSSEKKGFEEASKYLESHTEEGDFYIDGAYLMTLSISSGRSAMAPYLLKDETLRKSVKERGFLETMKRYKIKYYIDLYNPSWQAFLGARSIPDYQKFANLFSEKPLLSPGYRRGDFILSQLGGKRYYHDYKNRQKVIQDYQIPDRFYLEKVIGDYAFYRFKDPTQN